VDAGEEFPGTHYLGIRQRDVFEGGTNKRGKMQRDHRAEWGFKLWGERTSRDDAKKKNDVKKRESILDEEPHRNSEKREKNFVGVLKLEGGHKR